MVWSDTIKQDIVYILLLNNFLVDLKGELLYTIKAISFEVFSFWVVVLGVPFSVWRWRKRAPFLFVDVSAD